MSLDLIHLGWSGLRIRAGTAILDLDPPEPGHAPAVVTWTEAERVRGARQALGAVAAAREVLTWLGRDGIPLEGDVALGAFTVHALPYAPIPYATPPEALRKTLSALRSPVLAMRRLSHTLGRPGSPPLTLAIRVGERRIAYLAQALHRFVGEEELARLRRLHRDADVLVAGTDFDDEESTGRLMGTFGAARTVLFDAIGPIRRRLGLPMRPPEACLAHAPVGTLWLGEGARSRFEGAPCVVLQDLGRAEVPAARTPRDGRGRPPSGRRGACRGSSPSFEVMGVKPRTFASPRAGTWLIGF